MNHIKCAALMSEGIIILRFSPTSNEQRLTRELERECKSSLLTCLEHNFVKIYTRASSVFWCQLAKINTHRWMLNANANDVPCAPFIGAANRNNAIAHCLDFLFTAIEWKMPTIPYYFKFPFYFYFFRVRVSNKTNIMCAKNCFGDELPVWELPDRPAIYSCVYALRK